MTGYYITTGICHHLGGQTSYTIFEPSKRGTSNRTMIIMSGAGTATQERYVALSARATTKFDRVITFDYFGHGISSGSLEKQSLRGRYEQVIDLIRHLSLEATDLTLLGFSMSGQTIADLVGRSKLSITHIVLCCPAVYSQHAWSLRFDSGFTDEIRRKESWTSSSAFDNLAEYSGYAVLVLPERDEVVPPAVATKLGACLKKAELKTWIVPNASHQLGSWFANHPEDIKRLVAMC